MFERISTNNKSRKIPLLLFLPLILKLILLLAPITRCSNNHSSIFPSALALSLYGKNVGRKSKPREVTKKMKGSSKPTLVLMKNIDNKGNHIDLVFDGKKTVQNQVTPTSPIRSKHLAERGIDKSVAHMLFIGFSRASTKVKVEMSILKDLGGFTWRATDSMSHEEVLHAANMYPNHCTFYLNNEGNPHCTKKVNGDNYYMVLADARFSEDKSSPLKLKVIFTKNTTDDDVVGLCPEFIAGKLKAGKLSAKLEKKCKEQYFGEFGVNAVSGLKVPDQVMMTLLMEKHAIEPLLRTTLLNSSVKFASKDFAARLDAECKREGLHEVIAKPVNGMVHKAPLNKVDSNAFDYDEMDTSEFDENKKGSSHDDRKLLNSQKSGHKQVEHQMHQVIVRHAKPENAFEIPGHVLAEFSTQIEDLFKIALHSMVREAESLKEYLAYYETEVKFKGKKLSFDNDTVLDVHQADVFVADEVLKIYYSEKNSSNVKSVRRVLDKVHSYFQSHVPLKSQSWLRALIEFEEIGRSKQSFYSFEKLEDESNGLITRKNIEQRAVLLELFRVFKFSSNAKFFKDLAYLRDVYNELMQQINVAKDLKLRGKKEDAMKLIAELKNSGMKPKEVFGMSLKEMWSSGLCENATCTWGAAASG